MQHFRKMLRVDDPTQLPSKERREERVDVAPILDCETFLGTLREMRPAECHGRDGKGARGHASRRGKRSTRAQLPLIMQCGGTEQVGADGIRAGRALAQLSLRERDSRTGCGR